VWSENALFEAWSFENEQIRLILQQKDQSGVHVDNLFLAPFHIVIGKYV